MSVLEIIHMVLSTKMVFKHLKPKIRKKGLGAFLGKYEKLHQKKFWTDVPVQKSQVCHLCLQYVSKKSDNSEGQIQNTYGIIQFLKKESLQLVIVSIYIFFLVKRNFAKRVNCGHWHAT